MDMKESVESYLFDALDVCVEVRQLVVAGIDGRYEAWRVKGLAVEFVLIAPRQGARNPAVGKIASDIVDLRAVQRDYVAFGTELMSATERMRLIRHRVPFVVPGRQLYLPFLGLALREDGRPQSAKWLGISAQRLLLTALREELDDPVSDLAGERIANCSRATVFRAFRELEYFGLVRRTSQGPVFVERLPQAFAEAQPRMRKSDVRDAIVQEVDRQILS